MTNSRNNSINSLIDELSDLLSETKSKPTVKDDETNQKSSNSKTIEDIDVNTLQTSLETIAEMLERDDCDQYFHALFPLILHLKTSINSLFWINSGDNKQFSPNSAELTYSNVNLNSIWETISYKIEKLIMNSMIRCDYFENELDFERVCSELGFLYDLKDNKLDKQTFNEGLDIWRLFDTIRVCKLESDAIESTDRPIDWFLNRLVLMINFDLRLYKSGYFGAISLQYSQLVMPYIQTLKVRFTAELSLLNTNIDNLIALLKCMIQLDRNLEQIKQEFPRLMESPETDEQFEFNWKAVIESNINVNLFHKMFSHFNDYEYLCCLDSFKTFLSYAISANIIDFFVHHFNDVKHNSWTEFDGSTILSTEPRIWWYTALEGIITPLVDKHLMHNLKALINKSLISSVVTPEIKEIYTSNQLIYEGMTCL
ncbi:unnamed protein product [Oppiella nova]|uniref:Uncharacterized protein n=1 Tax=Oppiella nova TaxID=334625 RepID=A0A7R9LVA6_9ACAR|nr:unnamed protein product [Oppiella nova]CAG2167294.1 unnamed protein product [Oppiella nova]